MVVEGIFKKMIVAMQEIFSLNVSINASLRIPISWMHFIWINTFIDTLYVFLHFQHLIWIIYNFSFDKKAFL